MEAEVTVAPTSCWSAPWPPCSAAPACRKCCARKEQRARRRIIATFVASDDAARLLVVLLLLRFELDAEKLGLIRRGFGAGAGAEVACLGLGGGFGGDGFDGGSFDGLGAGVGSAARGWIDSSSPIKMDCKSRRIFLRIWAFSLR